MWNTSNSKIIVNWEQVKALENESEVTGYKVDAAQPLCFLLIEVCGSTDCGFNLRFSTRRTGTAGPASWKPTPPQWSWRSPPMRTTSFRLNHSERAGTAAAGRSPSQRRQVSGKYLIIIIINAPFDKFRPSIKMFTESAEQSY